MVIELVVPILKAVIHFLDLIHSFSARGQNVDFWLLSKNNTGRLPLGGNPVSSKKQTPYFRTYSRRALYDLPQTLHGSRARRAHHKRCHPFFDLIHSFEKKSFEIGQGSRPCWSTLYQKVEYFDIFGAAFPPLCTD